MKSKILKILGVLALTTLSADSMAWKVNYRLSDGSDQQIEMLGNDVRTDIFCNIDYSSVNFVKFDADNKLITALENGEKADCLIFGINENKLAINADALRTVNKPLIEELERFCGSEDNVSNLNAKFATQLSSVIESYHISLTLGIRQGEYSDESAFIDLVLEKALKTVWEQAKSHGGLNGFKSKILERLFGDEASLESVKNVSNTLLLINLCYNKCKPEHRGKDILKCFFFNQDSDGQQLNDFEKEAVSSITDPFLIHSCKHILHPSMVADHLHENVIEIRDINAKIRGMERERLNLPTKDAIKKRFNQELEAELTKLRTDGDSRTMADLDDQISGTFDTDQKLLLEKERNDIYKKKVGEERAIRKKCENRKKDELNRKKRMEQNITQSIKDLSYGRKILEEELDNYCGEDIDAFVKNSLFSTSCIEGYEVTDFSTASEKMRSFIKKLLTSESLFDGIKVEFDEKEGIQIRTDSKLIPDVTKKLSDLELKYSFFCVSSRDENGEELKELLRNGNPINAPKLDLFFTIKVPTSLDNIQRISMYGTCLLCQNTKK